MIHHEHILKVEGIHVHYGKVCALHNISFETTCGCALALVGANGSGKSTLLKTIIGLVPAQQGRVLWCGNPVEQHRFEIAYLPQKEQVDWNFPLTIRGLVEMGRFSRIGSFRSFTKEDHKIVDRSLDEMQITDLQNRHISSLSGGQQQRAFIARALAQEPHVLLLDEPLNGLDRPSKDTLTALIKNQVTNGKLLIASHHDISTTSDIFDTVLLLKRSAVAFGPVETTPDPGESYGGLRMIDALFDTLSYTFNQRALLAAALTGFLNGFFGSYVVLRRKALFAGALTHTLFPGIALASLFYGINPLSALIGSVITALAVSVGAQKVAARTKADINTVLAIFWTASFAAGLLILKALNEYINIEHYLFGNILSVSNMDIIFIFIAGYFICSTVILMQRKIFIMAFSADDALAQGINVPRVDYLMAGMLVIVMITSLQAVGIILTLGLLVAPAATIALFVNSPRVMLWGGGVFGALLASASLFLSNALNVQTGALIVLLLGILYIIAALVKTLISNRDTTKLCD